MNENYGSVVKDAYVIAYFKEPRRFIPNDLKYKKPAMRDKLVSLKLFLI